MPAVANGLGLVAALLLLDWLSLMLRLWHGRLVVEIMAECDRRGMVRPDRWPYVALHDNPDTDHAT